MLVELKAKSQMTIPKSVVSELGLNVGDQFEVVIQDGNIVLIPIVVYPKAKLESLIELATQAREELKSGKTEVFADFDQALSFLHENTEA